MPDDVKLKVISKTYIIKPPKIKPRLQDYGSRTEYTIYTRNPRATEEQLYIVGFLAGGLVLAGIAQLIHNFSTSPEEDEE